jgi:hypothetical protein
MVPNVFTASRPVWLPMTFPKSSVQSSVKKPGSSSKRPKSMARL